jgi:hypothetical protein
VAATVLVFAALALLLLGGPRVQPIGAVVKAPASPAAPPTRPSPPGGGLAAPDRQRTQKSGEWRSLLSGTDLAEWELAPGAQAAFAAEVVEGEPVLHVRGQPLGALTSRAEYGDFHLRGEFRWAETPGATAGAGLIYHGSSRPTDPRGWLAGLEFRLGPGPCGSLGLSRPANISIQTAGRLTGHLPPGETVPLVQYTPGGQSFTVPLLVPPLVLAADADTRPGTGWETFEILTVGDRSVHKVNGQVVLVLGEARRWVGLQSEPVTRGRIQIKSAGGAVSYRRLLMRPLRQLPGD